MHVLWKLLPRADRLGHRRGHRFFKPKDIRWNKRNPGWIRLTPGRRIMGLRQNRRGCQYLGKDERCTIYEHRPVTCRRYPFDVEFDEQGEIRRIGVSKSVECPYALDGYTALGQIKALCTWEDEEETPYYEKVKAWNREREVLGWKAFLQHLGF